MHDDRFLKMLVEATQANPGAMTALAHIYGDDPKLAAGIMAKMIITKSHGCLIWCIYSDECGKDLAKSKAMFERWLSSPKGTDSLGEWIIAEGLKSSFEAQYYLNQGAPP